MKKILFAFIFVLMLTACSSMPQTDYRYTVGYTIGDAEYTYENTISLPGDYVPIYILRNDGREHSIIVRGADGGIIHFFADIVYDGGIPCAVNSFDYKPIRTYRVSKWNGKEMKK